MSCNHKIITKIAVECLGSDNDCLSRTRPVHQANLCRALEELRGENHIQIDKTVFETRGRASEFYHVYSTTVTVFPMERPYVE